MDGANTNPGIHVDRNLEGLEAEFKILDRSLVVKELEKKENRTFKDSRVQGRDSVKGTDFEQEPFSNWGPKAEGD